MAERDPNAIVSEGWIDKKADFEGLKIPDGVDKNLLGTQFYAYQRTYKNGRRVIEWYKRGSGGGAGGQGDKVMTTAEDTVQAIKDKWDEDERKQEAATKPPEERNNGGRRERWNPQANGGKGAWEDVGPAINTSTTATSDKPTIGRVEGTPMPDGTFDNTKPIWVERDPTTNQQVGPAKPLTPQQREDWEREKNGGLTDKEVRERDSPENRVGKPTGNTRAKTENGKTVKETEYLLPDGTKEWRTQEETAPPDRIGKPTGNTRERVEGGKQIKETEYVLPDGKTEWRTQEAPSTANQPLPKDMPPFAPDINKPGLGVIEYTAQLQALRAAGKITDKQFGEFVALAHGAATAEAGRLDTITRSQQQQQTNEINQRNADQNASLSRLSAANGATQNALDTSLKMAGNFTNATYAGAGGPILPAVMALQDMRAASWGGMYSPLAVGTQGYPMLQQMGQMAPGQPNPNTVIPAVQQLSNMAYPNQLGIGAIGNQPAPGAPPPVAGAAPAPQPAQPVAPAPVQQPGNVAPGPMSPNPPDISQTTAPVNPMPGQPGHDPSKPVGMAPMQQPGVLPAVNTLGIAAEVAARGGYSQDVMTQALRELGWA